MKRTYAFEAVVEIGDDGAPRIEYVRVRQVIPGGEPVPVGDAGEYDLHFVTYGKSKTRKRSKS